MPSKTLETTFEVEASASTCIAFLQDPHKLMGSDVSPEVTEIKREGGAPDGKIIVSERVDSMMGMLVTIAVDWHPTATGVRTSVSAALGLKVNGEWSASTVPPSDGGASSEASSRPKTQLKEVTTMHAPFYVLPLWPLIVRQYTSAREVRGPRITKAIEREASNLGAGGSS